MISGFYLCENCQGTPSPANFVVHPAGGNRSYFCAPCAVELGHVILLFERSAIAIPLPLLRNHLEEIDRSKQRTEEVLRAHMVSQVELYAKTVAEDLPYAHPDARFSMTTRIAGVQACKKCRYPVGLCVCGPSPRICRRCGSTSGACGCVM
jgi:hypothetical protein